MFLDEVLRATEVPCHLAFSLHLVFLPLGSLPFGVVSKLNESILQLSVVPCLVDHDLCLPKVLNAQLEVIEQGLDWLVRHELLLLSLCLVRHFNALGDTHLLHLCLEEACSHDYCDTFLRCKSQVVIAVSERLQVSLWTLLSSFDDLGWP